MIRVLLPSQLRSYSEGQAALEAAGGNVGAVLEDLDRRHPGLRFRIIDEQGRIRPHMRIFLNAERVLAIDAAVREGDELLVFGALSGGGGPCALAPGRLHPL